MYTLYYSPGAASLVVHWLLIEIGARHELRRLDLAAGEHKRPEYLAINPHGVVPTLLIHGEPVAEAAALVLHLADAHPSFGLAPEPGSVERAKYYQWVLHLANTMQPAFRTWFYPNEAAGEQNAEAAKTRARERIEACWDNIEAHLARRGPYLMGPSVSAADFLLAMLMRWSRNMPRPATDWPQLGALAQRMKARPSFRVLYEREGLTEWA
ncbi:MULTISPECIES: glutathione S-transferase family protein [unclassified Arenimonas]|uniref:glutathione S-transferase family protein n=1 Tax=unclassified Arenimonas TaxID=2641713 RepID=UPI00086D48E7|nr:MULTISPECIES: glutathione S-transferase family protein [unclassified Arenimonas]ODS65007.1 MAG: glutathione S-transferase [Arenimonas sp. SCN 70-307]